MAVVASVSRFKYGARFIVESEFDESAHGGYITIFWARYLPPAHIDFVGRQKEIELLVKALEPDDEVRIAGIHGMGGVGKTQLALQVAQRLRADYPHAQLLVELRGTREAAPDLITAMMTCIQALGGSAPEGAERPDYLSELVKSYQRNLSGKRVLVVLDDVTSEEQVVPFIPPPGCALLITSRRNLSPTDIKNPWLRNITPLLLAQLHAPEARALLISLAPRTNSEAADRIAQLYGYLPLALRAAGGLLSYIPDLDPAVYVERLRDARTRLKDLRVKSVEEGEADERAIGVEIDVEASFNLSYERLKVETKRVFRQLAVFPASFAAPAEEVICQDTSHEYLRGLVQLNLVMFDEKTKRYQLHDLARVYAGQCLSADERDAARQTHARYFLSVAQDIEQRYQQSPEQIRAGLEIFNAEWENLRAGQAWAEERAATNEETAALCVGYAEALQYVLYLRRHQSVQIKWLAAALAAGQLLQLRGTEGRLLCSLGTAYALREPKRALDYYERALRIARDIHDRTGEASALGNMGNVYARLGQNTDAIAVYKQCLLILEDLGNTRDASRTLTNLGVAYSNLGQSGRAVEFYQQALQAARNVDDRRGEAIVLSNLGKEYTRSGEIATAIERYEQAIKIMNEVDELRDKIAVLTGLGNAYSAQHKPDQAIECHQEALAISCELGDLSGKGTALGNLGNEYTEPRGLDQAIKFHEQALVISRQLGERESEVQDLGNLGHAYYLKGYIDKAITHHLQALTISREIDNPIHQGILYGTWLKLPIKLTTRQLPELMLKMHSESSSSLIIP